MPCQTEVISSHGQQSESTPGGGLTDSKPAVVQASLFERDPISTRVVRQGPHGLQLFIQLDNNAPPRTEVSRPKRHRNGNKPLQSHYPNEDIDKTIGEESPVKRSRTSRFASATTITSAPATVIEEESASVLENDQLHSVRTYSDRINRYFEQIEDADSWNDSSQTILVVLGDVMRQVQTFGLPDPSNPEHSALHEEIQHEVAQIEHLVHDYTENLRRMKTVNHEDES